MENHPIPQDITGFQFKLIGNMTVKQFAYLATGVILGWIITAMPFLLLIKLPIALVVAGIGASFAFLPIEGRPLDVMIGNFSKALFNPTQFVYQKNGADLYFPEFGTLKQGAIMAHSPVQPAISEEKLKSFLSSLPKTPKNKLDEKEISFLQTLNNISNPIIQAKTLQDDSSFSLPNPFAAIFGKNNLKTVVEPPKPVDMPTKEAKEEPEEKEEELQKEAVILQKQLEEAKQKEVSEKTGSKEYEAAHQKVTELEKILNETMLQKQQLENQLLELQKKLEVQNKKVYTPSMAIPEPQIKQTKHVRSIPKEMGKSVGLPISTDFPNVLTGIIKDSRNNPLPNILVEVKDEEGNPVRAFKTNPLGQFASATPLSNGIYTIDFEDPEKKHRFDSVEFQATGEIILPIEVISIDEREELRKSLFGN